MGWRSVWRSIIIQEVKLLIRTLRDGAFIAKASIVANAREREGSVACMTDRRSAKRITRLIVVGVATSFLFASSAAAIAGTRNASYAYCDGLVNAKNLKTAAERAAEREKCRMDPYNYK